MLFNKTKNGCTRAYPLKKLKNQQFFLQTIFLFYYFFELILDKKQSKNNNEIKVRKNRTQGIHSLFLFFISCPRQIIQNHPFCGPYLACHERITQALEKTDTNNTCKGIEVI